MQLAFSLSLLSLCFSFVGWSQIDDELTLNELYFSQDLLKNREIRSAHVLWENQLDDGDTGTFVLAKKRMEVDFSTEGRKEYLRYTPVITNFYGKPSPLGGRDTRYFTFEYEGKHLTKQCHEFTYGKMCEYWRYDEQGRLLSMSYDGDHSDIQTYTFQWSADGILEHVSYHGTQKAENKVHFGMDTEGKLSRVNHSDGTHTLYGYVDENDTATTYINHCYRDSSLSTITKRHFISTGQLFFEKKVMANADTVYLKRIQYDTNHQVISMYLLDNTERLEYRDQQQNNLLDGVPFGAEPESRVVQCNISNVYQDDLLTKREIRIVNPAQQNEERMGLIIERIQYDQAPLTARPWKYEEEELWDR